jgi:hypothetical protein
MINMHTTRLSLTIFRKHKYISNPTIYPIDTASTATKNLSAALKGKMPHYHQESPLGKLNCLSRIFSNTKAISEPDARPHTPVILQRVASVEPELRPSLYLQTNINQDGQITALPSSSPVAPVNPPIPWPQYIKKAMKTLPRRLKKICNMTLLFCPVASTLRVTDTDAPPPRVISRRFSSSKDGADATSSKGGRSGPSYGPYRKNVQQKPKF